MLWSLHTENTRIISRGIIFDVLGPIWSRYFNVTDTFCQFCGISGINDLESRLEVFWGRWFLHQSKGFLLVLDSNFGPILPCSRAIRAFVRWKPLFRYPSPIPVKIPGCFRWSRSVLLGSAKSEHPS